MPRRDLNGVVFLLPKFVADAKKLILSARKMEMWDLVTTDEAKAVIVKGVIEELTPGHFAGEADADAACFMLKHLLNDVYQSIKKGKGSSNRLSVNVSSFSGWQVNDGFKSVNTAFDALKKRELLEWSFVDLDITPARRYYADLKPEKVMELMKGSSN